MAGRFVLEEMIAAYGRRGFGIQVGLNSYQHNNNRDVPFAYLKVDNNFYPFGAGISIQEIYFFECLSHVFFPKNIFIIGNSFGWSTIGLSLIFPNSQIVAIDRGAEDHERKGVELTNQIAAELRLNAQAFVATSPEDVGTVVTDHLQGVIDMAFVDSMHTNEQQTIDYQAVKPFINRDGAIVFHDIINWGMVPSFEGIMQDWNGPGCLLHRTPSGMGICYRDAHTHDIGRVARLFAGP